MSYEEFYKEYIVKHYKFSKEELKVKFMEKVDKKDYRKADLDEIIEYLFKQLN